MSHIHKSEQTITLLPPNNPLLYKIYCNLPKWMGKKLKFLIFRHLHPFEQNKYDEIISLGSACVTATTLRMLGARKASYPFDWVSKNNIYDRFELILNNFENYFELNDFSFYERHNKNYAHNNRTGFEMPQQDLLYARVGHFPYTLTVKTFVQRFARSEITVFHIAALV